MPRAGVPNNPAGVNSFDHFAPEPAYGEATKQNALQRSAPLAGGTVAAGPLQAPRRAQRRATRGGRAPAPASPPAGLAPPAAPSPGARAATVWQTIAQVPGASPLVQEYALVAQQQNQG